MQAQPEKAKVDINEIIITIIVVIVLVGGFYVGYQIDRNKKFEVFSEDGQRYLSLDKYTEAMDSFAKALDIKEDTTIRNLYYKTRRLQRSSDLYRTGRKHLDEGLLLEAIIALRGVSQESNYYEHAQELLEESFALLAEQQFLAAQEYYKEREFLNALESIRAVININPENSEAAVWEEKIIAAYNKEEEKLQKELVEHIIRLHEETEKQRIETIRHQMRFFEQDSGSIAIAVTQIDAKETINVGYNTLSFKDKKSHFLWIYVVVRNDDSKVNHISIHDFTLSLENGFTYNVDKNMHTFNNIFQSINLPAGNTSGGWILFSASKSDIYILNYNSQYGSARKEIVLN